jgi:hypothetical protein
MSRNWSDELPPLGSVVPAMVPDERLAELLELGKLPMAATEVGEFSRSLEYAEALSAIRELVALRATVARLEGELRAARLMVTDMLCAADSNWEERGEGNDWQETCKRARALPGVSTAPAVGGEEG